MLKILKIFFIILAPLGNTHAGSISKNHTFTPGTTISSSQINSNFDQLIAELNAKETRITTLEGAGGGTWSLSGSDVYYNAGNVGIGTAAPSQKLDVTGNVNISNQINVRDEATFGYTSGSTGGVYLAKPATYGKPAIQSVTSAFGVDNLLLNPAGGNVGIGTTSPNGKLEISHTSDFSLRLTNTGANGDAWDLSNLAGAGNAGGFRFYNADNTAEYMRITNAGNVGIGTTDPQSKLDVTGGNVRLQNTGTGFTTGFGIYAGATPNNGYVWMDFTSANVFTIQGGNNIDTFSTPIVFQNLGGNVGISDTSPDTKLKVVGAICAKSNDANCAGNVAGTVYANNTTVQSADYAEYFLAEETLNKGDVVGLNPKSRLARGYKAGDKLLGIVSTSPGIAGNSEIQNRKSVLVALLGQVPFNKEQAVIKRNTIHTFDGKQIGYLLADGKVYLNISSTDQLQEINDLKQEIKDLKKLVFEMVKHHDK